MGLPYVEEKPEIIEIDPDSGQKGITGLNIHFSGENTHFGTTTRVAFPETSCIHITSMTPGGPEKFTITINIDASCPTGYKDVKVETVMDFLDETIIVPDGFLVREKSPE